MISAMIKFQQSRYCHITPLLFNLHWLPVKFRIPFKIILITFKALKRLAPAYVASLISIKSPPRYNLRSSRDLSSLVALKSCLKLLLVIALLHMRRQNFGMLFLSTLGYLFREAFS